ncbi:hypothetical protein SDC9_96840 [bioreactor metagenome]|uniref:Uncharacterized protein n=1 Tax=bioreactor metagenome TaxID=1076179 RepID=A0A645AA68_9ZZZZ
MKNFGSNVTTKDLLNQLSSGTKEKLQKIMWECIKSNKDYEEYIVSSKLIGDMREKLGDDGLKKVASEFKNNWVKDGQFQGKNADDIKDLQNLISGMLGHLIKESMEKEGFVSEQVKGESDGSYLYWPNTRIIKNGSLRKL